MLDVLVVGAGPAGLAAATALRARERSVIVVDREVEPGGVPRHCDHWGFGWLDLRRVLSGPRYARRHVELARDAGVEIRTETTVLGWRAGTALALTSPAGLSTLSARAILLATGCRERPRSARLVAGDRPAGVFTTGSLQQLVHLEHQRPGTRAVVIGAEHVSFSAMQTLRDAGARVVAIVTPHGAHQTYAPFRWWTTRGRLPLLVEHDIVGIYGDRRVSSVTLRSRTGTVSELACDTVVFTGDWIPDHELARLGGLELDRGTRGPAVDSALRTSRPGVFAAGNVLHGAEMADVAALEGRAAAAAIDRFLDDGHWPACRLAISVHPPLSWIVPNQLAIDDAPAPPRERFVFRVATFLRDVHVAVAQGGTVLSETRFARLVPNRWYHLSSAFLARVDPAGGDLAVRTVGE
jgi:thioredoxin reductase